MSCETVNTSRISEWVLRLCAFFKEVQDLFHRNLSKDKKSSRLSHRRGTVTGGLRLPLIQPLMTRCIHMASAEEPGLYPTMILTNRSRLLTKKLTMLD